MSRSKNISKIVSQFNANYSKINNDQDDLSLKEILKTALPKEFEKIELEIPDIFQGVDSLILSKKNSLIEIESVIQNTKTGRIYKNLAGEIHREKNPARISKDGDIITEEFFLNGAPGRIKESLPSKKVFEASSKKFLLKEYREKGLLRMSKTKPFETTWRYFQENGNLLSCIKKFIFEEEGEKIEIIETVFFYKNFPKKKHLEMTQRNGNYCGRNDKDGNILPSSICYHNNEFERVKSVKYHRGKIMDREGGKPAFEEFHDNGEIQGNLKLQRFYKNGKQVLEIEYSKTEDGSLGEEISRRNL